MKKIIYSRSPSEMAFDEADAAGVALCHAFTWRG